MKKIWLYITLSIVIFIDSACSGWSAASSLETPVVTSPPAVEQSNDENVLLLWEGSALFAEDPTECHRLRVTQDYQVFIGLCDGQSTEVEYITNQIGGLADMVSRFASFQSDSQQGHITFNGQGEIAGPPWERAVTTWAQFTYAELASGRIGAANRTVLVWNLGEQSGQPGQCQRLLVLAHGYAIAGLTPCQGGQMEVVGSGWVDPAAWEQFDVWLYNNAPFYQNDSYLDGRGTAEINADEAATLSTWAQAVYGKISQF